MPNRLDNQQVRRNPLAIRKRFGNEWTDIREFIRPNDFMVAELIDWRDDWTMTEIWDWVCRQISYPPEEAIDANPDWHHYRAFGRYAGLPIIGPLLSSVKYSSLDYWQFPSETLRDGLGDCDDSAILLTSMLRRAQLNAQKKNPDLVAHPYYATAGYLVEDGGHVWVTQYRSDIEDWIIIEPTLDEPPITGVIRESKALTHGHYRPLYRFNEKEVIIVDWEAMTRPTRRRDSWYMLLDDEYRIGTG